MVVVMPVDVGVGVVGDTNRDDVEALRALDNILRCPSCPALTCITIGGDALGFFSGTGLSPKGRGNNGVALFFGMGPEPETADSNEFALRGGNLGDLSFDLTSPK